MMIKNIKEWIKLKGYIAIDEFMSMAIPYYYKNNTVLGKHGDFTTAPEISQMFGDILGIWCADIFIQANSPRFQLVELGPGNGTLMKDVLRATKHIPGFHQQLQQVILVEISDHLIAKQQHALSPNTNCLWHKDLNNVPPLFTIFIANEFFDALPIKQFQVVNNRMHEVIIVLNKGDFAYALSPIGFPPDTQSLPDKAIIETNAAANLYANQISSLLSKSGGAAVIIDYGYFEPPYKSTLQAVRSHEHAEVFNDIGESDITALIDFKNLIKTFSAFDLKTKYTTQRDFLSTFGITQRAKQLIQNGADAKKINSELQRLISQNKMGKLFKVLEVKSHL